MTSRDHRHLLVPHADSQPEKLLLNDHLFRVNVPRRLLDVVVAGVALVVLSPVLLVAGLLVFLTDGRPPFSRRTVVGQHGVPFRQLRFRTTRAPGPAHVVAARIGSPGGEGLTSVGRALRRTGIAAWPQLWNVLCGQMTLVGPRAEAPALAKRYPLSCRPVLLARPGLTGPARLVYREDSSTPASDRPDAEKWYLTVVAPLRAAADLEYLLDPTFGQTLRTLALAIGVHLGIRDLRRPILPSGMLTVPAQRRAPALEQRAATVMGEGAVAAGKRPAIEPRPLAGRSGAGLPAAGPPAPGPQATGRVGGSHAAGCHSSGNRAVVWDMRRWTRRQSHTHRRAS